MKLDMKSNVLSNSPEQTESYAEKIGALLKAGDVIELRSDLGGGKTTFVRGLARGAGSADAVASPTFAICRIYESPSVRIYHFDLYRLAEAGLLGHDLQDSLDDPDAVVVIEWAGIVEHILPENRLKVVFRKIGDTQRELLFEATPSQEHLVKDLC
ncbi:tRNA (adenosine(37)-N6)-threonylcarbamoyltransferase complex ATPase subunit type 1 TsaE [soil metagenome]